MKRGRCTIETESSYKSNSNQYNSATSQLNDIHEQYNATRNWPVIQARFAEGRARDISNEPKTPMPCIIVGSGASLDEALPLLKDWKGGLICTTSHALTLVRWGAPPTHIYALDPFCTFDEIDGVDWIQYRTKLITTPTVWPSLIAKWPNDLILYRQSKGRKDSFYASVLNIMYSDRQCMDSGLRNAAFHPQIKTEITLFACSPPGQLFAAHVLGYTNIFLTGVDFGYTHGKDRFTNWTRVNGDWIDHPHPYDDLPQEVKDRQMIMSSNGIPMDTVHAFYKKNMISAWRLGLQDVWVTGQSAITEMPFCDIAHVIKKQGQHIKGFSKQQIAEVSETYLAGVGAHVIASEKGYTFVESNNPEVEMMDYMRGMNRQYFCTNCKAELMSPDDESKIGCECPNCKQKTLQRRIAVDIDGNMKRIMERVAAANKAIQNKEMVV